MQFTRTLRVVHGHIECHAEALGHSERIYAMRPILEHLLAGIQYALGDLKADDSPSTRR